MRLLVRIGIALAVGGGVGLTFAIVSGLGAWFAGEPADFAIRFALAAPWPALGWLVFSYTDTYTLERKGERDGSALDE